MGIDRLEGLGGAALVAGIVVAGACASAPVGQRVAPDGAVTLAPGQSAAIAPEPIQIRFDAVESDSRCPADVACIQAGEAVVRLTVVASDGSRQTYTLRTTGTTPVMHNGLKIELEALEPRPVSSRATRSADYRLTLRVSTP